MNTIGQVLEAQGITHVHMPCGKQVKIMSASSHTRSCGACMNIEAERQRKIWDTIVGL